MSEVPANPDFKWSAPWLKFFQIAPLGKANLIFLGARRQRRVVELTFIVLMMLRAADERRPFSRVLVLLPPDSPNTVLEELPSVTIDVRGYPLSEQEQQASAQKVIISEVASLDLASLVQEVRRAPGETFIVVVDGALYRPKNGDVTRVVQAPEDVWSEPLVRLTSECTAVLPEDCCLLVDTGVFLPKLRRNRQILQDQDNCRIWGVESLSPIDERFVARQRKWSALARRGHTTEVLAEIDSLADFSRANRLALMIQVLHQADDNERAVEFVRAYLDCGVDIDAAQRLQLAIVASKADEAELCATLLARCLGALRDQQSLERAFLLSNSIEASDIERACVERLATSYPDSDKLMDHRIRRLVLACSRSEAYEIFDPTRVPFDDFAHFVAETLRSNIAPDYPALLREVEARWPDWFVFAASAGIANARSRDLTVHVLRQAMQVDANARGARYAAKNLLWCLERLILERAENLRDYLIDAIRYVLKYLATKPADAYVREQLDELMSVDVSGSLGVVSLAYALLQQPQVEISVLDSPNDDSSTVDENVFVKFLEMAFEWLDEQGAADPTTTFFPEDLLQYSADVTLIHMEELANQLVEDYEDDNVKVLGMLVALAFSIGPHAPGRVDDLVILRIATSRMLLVGEAQMARDLVECGLRTTRGSSERSRLAWCAYANVFHRGGNAGKALLALGCAAATLAPVRPENAYYETVASVRALRDIGLTAEAQEALSRCEALLKSMGAKRSMFQRIETIRLSLVFSELASERSADKDAWAQLLMELFANLDAVTESRDELTPVLILCTQVQQLCQSLGIHVRAEDEARIDAAAAQLGVVNTGLFRIAANKVKNAKNLLSLVSALQSVRHSEDIGFDVQWVVRAARAFLAEDENLGNVAEAVFAAELLTEHGISSPASDKTLRLPERIESPLRMLELLACEKIDVELLAFDAKENLVRLFTRSGKTTVTRETGFSINRMSEWSASFPYGFGLDEMNKDPNLFYNGMRGLELRGSVPTPCLFVFDTKLNRIPPQLLLVEGELLGRNVATAVVPSLTWLESALRVTREDFGKPCAWISIESKDGVEGTLYGVAERLKDTLKENDIVLDKGAALPAGLKGAELAIVAAHGGLTQEETFFQVVSDEAVLRVSALDLARALEGAGVVVLFVCSGGRQTQHPNASTTVGLPKQLLDRGCLAVVASPWPLDSRVPSHWLPTFLEKWVEGERVIDANFAANRAVLKGMGDSPRDTMAMTVYGNPLLRRPR